MTTIAANLYEMAADTRVTWDDDTTSSSVKIYTIGSAILGATGDVDEIAKFIEWYTNGSVGKQPKRSKDFRVIRLNSEGLHIIDSNSYWLKLDDKFFAVGSGGQFAIGAMEMGATPENAVRIAAKHDLFTNSSITVFKLKG